MSVSGGYRPTAGVSTPTPGVVPTCITLRCRGEPAPGRSGDKHAYLEVGRFVIRARLTVVLSPGRPLFHQSRTC